MSSDDEKTFQEKVNEIKGTDEIKREETILKASDKTTNAKIRFQEKRLERKKSRMYELTVVKRSIKTLNQQKLVLIKL